MLYIVGLGAGDEDQIPYGVIKLLLQGLPLYLRSDHHPMKSFLIKEKIAYTSFDDVYERMDSFEEVYEEIICSIQKEALKRDIVYAVPGHPCVAEYTVKRLLAACTCKIVGGQSFFDACFAALKIDPIDGLLIMDALSFDTSKLVKGVHLLIPQVFDQLTASDVKLDLMEIYPEDYPVCIIESAGNNQERLTWLALYELDQAFTTSNLTTIFVPKAEE